MCSRRLHKKSAPLEFSILVLTSLAINISISTCCWLFYLILARDRIRFEYARPGPSEVYLRGEEYSNGAHTYSSRAAPQYPPPPHPPGGAAANFEEGGLGRHGLPPPPPPPHPGMGPHGAAFQVTHRLLPLARISFSFATYGNGNLHSFTVCVAARIRYRT